MWMVVSEDASGRINFEERRLSSTPFDSDYLRYSRGCASFPNSVPVYPPRFGGEHFSSESEQYDNVASSLSPVYTYSASNRPGYSYSRNFDGPSNSLNSASSSSSSEYQDPRSNADFGYYQYGRRCSGFGTYFGALNSTQPKGFFYEREAPVEEPEPDYSPSPERDYSPPRVIYGTSPRVRFDLTSGGSLKQPISKGSMVCSTVRRQYYGPGSNNSDCPTVEPRSSSLHESSQHGQQGGTYSAGRRTRSRILNKEAAPVRPRVRSTSPPSYREAKEPVYAYGYGTVRRTPDSVIQGHQPRPSVKNFPPPLPPLPPRKSRGAVSGV